MKKIDFTFIHYLIPFFVLLLINFGLYAQTPTVSNVSRCGTGTAVLTASGTPSGGSYRWYNVATGGTPIVGATAASFTTPSISTTTNFYVSTLAADGTTESGRAQATVTVQPAPLAQIVEGAIIGYCTNTNITLNAVPVAGATYQWQRFTPLGGGSFQNETAAGNNTTTYSISSPTTGFFRIAVTGTNGCTTFSPVIEVVPNYTPEAIILQGATGTVCVGQSFLLQAKTDELSVGNFYQWTFSLNNTTYSPLGGANLSSVSVNQAGYYKLQITKNNCTSTSDAIRLTQSPAPTASIQQGTTINFCSGGNTVLTAQTDIGNQFQWLVGSTAAGPFAPASGASTGMTYTANTSGFYIVEIGKDGCTTRSVPSEVIQEAAPVAEITNISPTSYCSGGSITLTAQTAANNSYQWKYSATASGMFTNIASATTANYTAAQAGFYILEVKKIGCISLVSSAPIEVRETKATIQEAPVASVCKGSSLTLNATLLAGATYRWLFSTTAGGTFSNASGTNNNPSYTTNVIGYYRLDVTRDGCTHSSVPVSVIEKSATITQGTSTTFCRGSSATLTADQIGGGLVYSWTYSTTLAGTYAAASGTNNAVTYSANKAGFYKVTVVDGACSNVSDPIALTESAVQPTALILQGTAAQFCIDSDVTVNTIEQTGATYSWKYSTSMAGPYAAASGVNNTFSYKTNVEGFYTVQVSNGGCSETSLPIRITQINMMPKPTLPQGATAFYCTGGNVKLVSLINMSNVTYQWQYSPTASGVFTPASGTNNTLEYTTNQDGFYKIRVTSNTCGTNISDVIEVRESANLPTAKILQASPAKFCAEGDVTLEAQTGVGYTYQWQYATTATGTFANASGANTLATYSANQVGFYRVQVTLGGCVITSTPVQTQLATATPKPDIEQGASVIFCEGGKVNINTTMKGTGYTYQWQFSPTATGTFANASGTSTNAIYSAGTVGFYRVVVSIPNCGNSTSDNIEATQSSQKPIALILQGSNAVFCVGTDVIIDALQGTGYSYQWKYSATPTGTFANASGTSNLPSYTANQAGFYVIEISLNGCSETSLPIAVTTTSVMPKPIISQGSTAAFCQGSSTTINAQTKSTKYTYRWEFSTTQTGVYTPASGTNNRDDYTINTAGFYRLVTSSPTCGSATSDPVQVKVSTVIPTAKILQGTGAVACSGGDIILDAETGTDYTYNWQFSPTATGTFANALGDNKKSTYTASVVGFYRVIVNLEGCSATSTAVNITSTSTMPKPAISQGSTVAFCPGGDITLNALTKSTKYTYQWLFSATATGTYANASGASTTDSYKTTQAGFYKLRTTSASCGTAESDPTELKQATEKPKAEIMQAPAAQFCSNGGDVILDALQGTDYTYRWKFSATATGTFANASGTNNLSSYTANQAGFYVVEISLNGCSETSLPVAVTTTAVMPKPVISQGSTAAFCQGSSSTINAQTKSTKYTYRWEFSTTQTGVYTPASGTNNRDDYTINTAGFYRLVTSSPTCGSATSDPVQVRVSTVIPTAKILQTDAAFCLGGDVGLDAETGTNYTYNWQFSPTATGTFTNASGDNKKSTYTASVVGFYRVIVNLEGCSATSTAVSVTSTATMPKPAISQGSTITFCVGGDITLNALTKSTKYSYQWLFSATATGTYANASGASTTDSYKTTQAGFYKLRTTSAACGTAESDPTELKQTTDKPTAEIIQAPTAQFCSNGGDVILEAQQEAGYSYRWKFSTTAAGAYTNAGGTNNLASYATNIAGFYVVEVSLNACIATSTPVQVSGTPTMPQATTVQTGVVQICKGESTLLNAKSKGTNYEYQWLYASSATGTFANASGNSTSPNYTASLSGFYRLKTSLPDCGTSTSAVIQIKEAAFIPSPTILQAPSIGLCSGGDVSLEVTPEPEVSYNWFFSDRRDGVYRTAEGSSKSAFYNAARIGFYKVSAALGACVKVSDAVEVRNITTLPAPDVLPKGKVFFCRGGSAVLRSLYRGTKITYQWQFSPTATGSFTNVNSGNEFSLGATQAGFYRVTISATGCGSATSALIEVAETTVLPVATILQGERAEFCVNGGDALLEAETNSSYNYQWKYAATADSAYVNAAGASNQATYLTSKAGLYILEVSVNGCKAISKAVQVVGVTTLSKPNILQGLNAVFCEGSVPTLQTTTKGTGYVYRWIFSTSRTGTFEQVSGNANTAAYTNVTTGFYRLEISRDGCGSNISDVISVSFKPNPTLTFSTPKIIETCEGANVQLGVNELVGGTYSWTGANNFTSSLSNPIVRVSGDGFYVLTITTNGCSVMDSVLVKIKGKTSFTATATDNICANERNGIIRLSSAAENLQYRLGTTGNFQVVTSFNSLAVGTYTVFSKNEFGCESTQTVNIKSSKPAGQNVNAGSDVSIQKGRAVKLLATGVKEYKWTPTVGLSDPTIADPVANPLRTTTYTVTGKDDTGCETFDEVVVTVNDNGDLVITNLLTPDNNGINDTWEIVNIDIYPDAEIKVFDRWGLEVFSTVGYNNTWDGKSKNGNRLPDGAYYYQVSVTIRGQRQVFSGAMNIMR